MKFKHLFWAIILITIGILAILGNFGVIHFSWLSVWRLWPLILIFWGISILPMKDTIKFILLLGTLVLTFAFYNRLEETAPWYMRIHNDYNDNNDDENMDEDRSSYNFRTQQFTVPLDSVCTKGVLSLDAAAGNFVMDDTSAEMLAFHKSGYIGNYELLTSGTGARKQIDLKLHDTHVKSSIKENNVTIKLSTIPSWVFKFSLGAASMDMDLSKYKIDSASFDAGASSIELKLGDKNPVQFISFDAGASSITVKIPRSSGCQVTSDSFLVSREFDGFDKKGDHTYQTPGFASSSNKIYISVQTAVSKIKIDRY
jgi:hypothetical protein